MENPDEVSYSDGKRWYHLREKKFISVTSMLALVGDDDWLPGARANHYKLVKRGVRDGSWHQYCQDAMLTGTYLHYRIGVEIAREAGLPPPEFEPRRPVPDNRIDGFGVMLDHWADFKSLTHPKVFNAGMELFVHSSRGYAGRLDAVLTFDEKLFMDALPLYGKSVKLLGQPRKNDRWVVDFKSSKYIYDDNYAQILAYYLAYNEMYPNNRANRMAILRMNPNGMEFVETRGDQDTLDAAILAARVGGFI